MENFRIQLVIHGGRDSRFPRRKTEISVEKKVMAEKWEK